MLNYGCYMSGVCISWRVYMKSSATKRQMGYTERMVKVS